ncbi:biogenesis of lysosome-related organelles complex 1 subunit 5-like [Acanthaster planci]|uniref:Biogenesis of lysosome-related organelles complex 1 subunit 5 n=1 Tax=Acanthaster planci TaxID=133434 RepID=A0A8B7XTG9_ACAPL|nr:biogenesis of lysosome-related organelles complex 1 subunit 5-like [Acanthaster planci]
MVENVIKDLGEIHARLLDHKPVIQGEIRFFIKEFEGKRNDREQKRLERIATQMKDLNEKIFPGCSSLMDKHCQEALEQLEVTNMMCRRLQKQEEDRLESKPLEKERAKREEDWKVFLERLNEQRDALDSEHQRKIDEIEAHYNKLKQTLNTQS